jgi:hypothetical protein
VNALKPPRSRPLGEGLLSHTVIAKVEPDRIQLRAHGGGVISLNRDHYRYHEAIGSWLCSQFDAGPTAPTRGVVTHGSDHPLPDALRRTAEYIVSTGTLVPGPSTLVQIAADELERFRAAGMHAPTWRDLGFPERENYAWFTRPSKPEAEETQQQPETREP